MDKTCANRTCFDIHFICLKRYVLTNVKILAAGIIDLTAIICKES